MVGSKSQPWLQLWLSVAYGLICLQVNKSLNTAQAVTLIGGTAAMTCYANRKTGHELTVSHNMHFHESQFNVAIIKGVVFLRKLVTILRKPVIHR